MKERVFITGSPGSGKSTLEEIDRRSGSPTINTDDRKMLGWGRKEGELPEGVSFLKLLRTYSPRFDWGEIHKQTDEKPGARLYGATPPNLRDLLRMISKGEFERIEYLNLPAVLVPQRLKDRKGNPFGTSDAEVATSVVYAVVMNPVMRLASLIDSKRVRIHDARKPPEQLLAEITDGQSR